MQINVKTVAEDTIAPAAAASGVATWRLNLLRAAYLLMSVGIATTYSPFVLNHPRDFPLGMSLTFSLLSGLGLASLLGLRYPLQMLPLLLFEIAWKAIYLVGFALPLWRAGLIDAETAEYIKACLMVVVFVPIIPWDYVYRALVVQPAECWR
jgi:hypothetical protein